MNPFQASDHPSDPCARLEASEDLLFSSFPVGPLQCNCTILGDPVTKSAVIIDPGGDADLIIESMTAMGLTTVVGILHTHAHFDHILAAGHIKAHCQAPIALHQGDQFLWDHVEDQCQRFHMPCEALPPPDQWLEHEQPLDINGLKGVAFHTPGHTPGSMSFWFESHQLLVAGDTLFRGSIGRTDLWGGDFNTIEQSIRERLYTLDEAATVITGHGPATVLGYEMRHNPFVRASQN